MTVASPPLPSTTSPAIWHDDDGGDNSSGLTAAASRFIRCTNFVRSSAGAAIFSPSTLESSPPLLLHCSVFICRIYTNVRSIPGKRQLQSICARARKRRRKLPSLRTHPNGRIFWGIKKSTAARRFPLNERYICSRSPGCTVLFKT